MISPILADVVDRLVQGRPVEIGFSWIWMWPSRLRVKGSMMPS